MDITIPRDHLADALQVCTRIIASKASRLSGGVLLQTNEYDEIEIIATDLQTVFSTRLQSVVRKPGSVVLSAKWLQDVVKVLSNSEVDIMERSGEDAVALRSGSSRYILRTIPLDIFPQVTTEIENSVCSVVLEKDDFERAVGQVAVAAGTDEARPLFTGCLIDAGKDRLKFVATDSYRLAERRLEAKVTGEDVKVVIGARILEEVSRLKFESRGKVTLNLGKDSASFEIGQHRLKTRYIEGTFPDYERLIPQENPNKCEAARHAFMESVRRVSVLARDLTPVKISLSEQEVVVEVKDTEIGEATDVVEGAIYRGEDLEIAFNPKYLMDGVGGCEGERVVIEMKDSLSAVLVRGEGDDRYRHLIMPIRL